MLEFYKDKIASLEAENAMLRRLVSELQYDNKNFQKHMYCMALADKALRGNHEHSANQRNG